MDETAMSVGTTMAGLVHEFEFAAVPLIVMDVPLLPIPLMPRLPQLTLTPPQSLRIWAMSGLGNGNSPTLSVLDLSRCPEASAAEGTPRRQWFLLGS